MSAEQRSTPSWSGVRVQSLYEQTHIDSVVATERMVDLISESALVEYLICQELNGSRQGGKSYFVKN